MKLKLLTTIVSFLFVVSLYSQDNVGIGTTTPNASAILDLTSTSKGFLPPRLTTTQRDAIGSPATGLVIYNTTSTQFQFYNGSSWQNMSGLSSVALAAPTIFGVTGSPLTSNGTITISLENQNANLVFAGPSTGSPAAPTFRSLVANDIPNLDVAKITSGLLPVDRGGSGVGTLTGILKGNGTSAFTAITNTTGNVTYWADANTISGTSNFAFDAANNILAVTGAIRHVPGSAPGSPSAGMTYYNSTSNKLFLWDGSTWVDLGAGGGSVPSGTDAQTLRYNGTTLEATSLLRVTGTNVAMGSAFTPTSLFHTDAGNATANYHKFSAGTTTGTTATDGFDIGVDASGNGIIKNFENLPIILSTNNTERMRINSGGGISMTVTNTPTTVLNLNNDQAGGSPTYLNITNAFTGNSATDGLRIGLIANGDAVITQQETTKSLSLINNSITAIKIWEDGQIGLNKTDTFNDTVKVWLTGDMVIEGDLVVTGNIDPKSIQLVPQNSPPVSYASAGFMYYDNNTSSIKVTDGTGWSDIGTKISSDIDLKNSDNTAKLMKFFEPSSSGTNYSAFRAQTQAADIVYTLPSSLVGADTYLKNDGNGNLSWASPGGIAPGTISMYAGTTAPSGWVLCDGTSYGTSGDYAALFAVISYTYGGSGGNFNVPDLRGRFPLGADNMGGNSANRVVATDADNLGQGSGAENVTLTTQQIPSHNHDLIAKTTTSPVGGASGKYFASRVNNSPEIYVSSGSSDATMNSGSISNTGGGEAHNNMPPYMTINYIIKL